MFSLFLFGVVGRAAAAEPALSAQWLALGHYQPSGSGYVSTIDSPDFFLSPDGKSNPRAELNATLNLFASADEEKKCLFPARYKFLKRRGLVSSAFPACAEYEQFYDDLRPAGVTLLFTDAYMNNPSSLFGHTLLRIDTARKGTQLLAHGANYGAFTDGRENGLLYAVYGLTGGYYGGFTVKPYYDIINTYNNIENRDIWEFNLNLTPEELDFFVAHLWEVGHAQSRYFFFTRNCSYMLMEVFDAVRPELRLAQKFPVQAIPLDTAKAAASVPGLVKDVKYRPSRQAKINHRYKLMSAAQHKAYSKIIHEEDYGGLTVLTEAEQADVVETAYQFIQYQYVAEKLSLKDYRRQSFKALTERSRLSGGGSMPELSEGKSPLKAHESMRATAGLGVRNGQGFEEVSYRPAYHSLTDNTYGLLSGAEINFLNTVLRHYDNDDKYVLQQFELVGIRSLSPINEMFTPVSFQVSAGIKRFMNPDDEDEGYVADLKVGGGGSFALGEHIVLFGLANGYGAYGGFLPNNQLAGLSFEGGFLGGFDRLRFLGVVEKMYATSKIASYLEYRLEAAVALTTNTALAATYLYRQNYGHDIDEAVLGFRGYF